MTPPFIYTSVIIRLLTGDDATKQQRSELFRRIEVGGMIAAAPTTLIAESDAYIAAFMRAGHSTELYSYDSNFDRIPDITGLEP